MEKSPMALNASYSVNGVELCECNDMELLRDTVEQLYNLLDHIDTLPDMIKPNTEKGYVAYYNAVEKTHREKSKFIESDGYKLFIGRR